MGNSTIFNGTAIKLLKNILRTKHGTELITGDSDDPTLVAKNAPIGSLYIRSSNGALYKKLDAGSSTNWQPFNADSYIAADGLNYYMGDSTTDGTIRLTNNAGTLEIYHRVAGTYVKRGEI